MGNSGDDKTVILIVLGMHRSGTSCLMGLLEKSGLYSGWTQKWSRSNLKGNREHRKIRHLNDELLAYNGGSWRCPPEDISWSEALASKRDAILSRMNRRSRGLWGFKDPRTVLTQPFWFDGISRLKIVSTFRHPIEVARSLNRTWGLPLTDGVELWYLHNKKILETFKESEFPIVQFGVDSEEYLERVRKLSMSLGLEYDESSQNNKFFDPNLIHFKEQYEGKEVSRKASTLFEELKEIYEHQELG